MQTLKQIRKLLSSIDSRPVKRFGQCFLIDLHLMQKVLDLADLTGQETVLEVGPGTGSLTEELLTQAKRVVAAEIDYNLAALLRQQFADRDNFTLIEGDAMASKHAVAPAILQAVAPEAHLVANLPYNIATPLVAECLIQSWQNLHGNGVRFSRLTFTVQKEVAERMAAGPDRTSDYGAVSVLLSTLGKVQLGRVVPASAFWPAPKIDSQIVRIDFDDTTAGTLADVQTLQNLLHQTFTQRRKHIGKTARARNAPFEREIFAAALEECRIDRNRRVETVHPEEFLRLANQLAVKKSPNG